MRRVYYRPALASKDGGESVLVAGVPVVMVRGVVRSTTMWAPTLGFRRSHPGVRRRPTTLSGAMVGVGTETHGESRA